MGALVLSRICLSNNLCRFKNLRMAGQDLTGNVIAALCSFFIRGASPVGSGLRLLMAIIQFCLAAVLWFVLPSAGLSIFGRSLTPRCISRAPNHSNNRAGTEVGPHECLQIDLTKEADVVEAAVKFLL